MASTARPSQPMRRRWSIAPRAPERAAPAAGVGGLGGAGGGQRAAGRAGREPRAQPAQAVAAGLQHGQGVDAAVQEDRDQHARRLAFGGTGDAVGEGAEVELRAAVDRQRQARGARQEALAREARAGGQRHPGLDGGQALAGQGGAAGALAAGVVGAVGASGHEVWRSGLVATSMRSALRRSARYGTCFHRWSESSVQRRA
jgi:hypothetical protein